MASKSKDSQPKHSQPPTNEAGSGSGTVGESAPRPLSTEDAASTLGVTLGATAPSALPPEAALGGVMAWLTEKRINALWAINENRNAWVGIAGVGWRKLANNSDTAIVALTLLAAHARNTQTRVDYREEAGPMIHEMYVW